MNRRALQSREAIEQYQLASVGELLVAVGRSNAFYRDVLREAGLDGGVADMATFIERMPLTTKQQVVDDQLAPPPYGTNRTYSIDRYTRFNQTSGTTGSPMRWLDTAADWQWMLDNWLIVLDAAGAQAGDRAFFAFSFGPFLGFWTAFEAAVQAGMLCIPGGGMSSSLRLKTIMDNEVKLLLCTPTYAVRLGESAGEHGIDLGDSPVRTIIVGGEPGASVPATRAQIEGLWPGARVFDHHGMTEVGPVSFENPQQPGVLHIIESGYLAEIIDPKTLGHVVGGGVGELVLTTLGRVGAPLLRYRTGDLVCQSTRSAESLGRSELALEGGILGRCDDMVVIRGVNVFPSAVDQIVRGFEAVAEFRVHVAVVGGLAELRLVIEPAAEHAGDASRLCDRVSSAMRDVFSLRVPVSSVLPGELERFEFKSKRWVRD